MNWYLEGFRNYFNFSGRARRKEYWIFTIVNFLIFWSVLYLLDITVPSDLVAIIFASVFLLVTLIPSLSVMIRRLHDIGKSGWWYFIVLIPIAGAITLFVFTCMESEPDNRYGTNPRKLHTPLKEEAVSH
ncbi:DUF805 domain-containing protein [Sutcliffiella horikoshii]|uniref:DUF805 domain-containing protein n=1 Tax=Sutcliffiella horikoshii TaxID=79883 RepID=UPI0007D074D9|nr:DUF805 domain-containing protein [Sutcliffiella horikoshii]MCM3617018.1 DUF805 domain-containing protein [Sutcliffiella horikoshii]